MIVPSLGVVPSLVDSALIMCTVLSLGVQCPHRVHSALTGCIGPSFGVQYSHWVIVPSLMVPSLSDSAPIGCIVPSLGA